MESERREIANTETPVPVFLHTVKGTAQVSNLSITQVAQAEMTCDMCCHMEDVLAHHMR